MPTATSPDGTALHYDTIGDPAEEALLLIMGFTAQMTAWDTEFCRALAERGRFVIRFDNRDCGLSTKTGGPPPDVMALFAAVVGGQEITVDVPYSLSDMALDGLAVLDDLEIDRAHLVGASMGGMIAQQTAIEHPGRVRSLTSIMSTTGDRSVGQGTPESTTALLTPSPTDREGAIERGVAVGRAIAGPHFDEAEARRRQADAYDRSFHPIGAAFQLAAIARTGDRTEGLRGLQVPTTVIHGAVDPLIDVSGGRATAAAVPGAELVILDEMGHDLPRPLWPQITDAIIAAGNRADAP